MLMPPPVRDVLSGFDAALAARPDEPAVVSDGTSRTYADLDRESRGYAAALRATGVVGPESVVAVVAERGPRYVAMVLGVLRAGAAFLPLEPVTPAGRAHDMCRQAGVDVLLVEPGLEDHVAAVVGAGSGWSHAVVPAVPAGDVLGEARARDGLAYVIFTSGSTGMPKGAMVTDGGMASHVEAKRLDLDLTAADVIGFTAPLSFDISVWQALTAVTLGGRVCVASRANLAEPVELLAWIRTHGVTVCELVPSFLTLLVDELADERLRSSLASLRYLVATGEALPAELARRWYACCPDIPLVNAYGPTECSDDVTHHVVTAADREPGARLPIGREIIGTEIHVVDADGRPVGPGVAGELIVGGAGVGRGYIGDPVATALAFVPGAEGTRLYRTGDRGLRRTDGTLDYLGRRDRQVKIRGHRVELGDAEAQLLRVPGVASAACVLVSGRLVAYVTSRAGAEQVLDQVRATAPAYLVPHEVTVLDHMPTNAAGKIDHLALAARAAAPATGPVAAGESLTLDEVRAAVAEVLGAEAVGPDDDFFAAGGDSLVAMRLVSLARKRFGAEAASLPGFLADPTPRGLLAVLTAARAAPAAERQEGVPGALSSGQERLWFLEQLHPNRDPLVIRLELALRGNLDGAALRHALNAVVRRHEPLRTVFSQERGAPVGTVWPSAEIDLADTPDDGTHTSGLSARTPRPPLMTARLTPVTADQHVLTLVMHHLVCDGWSLAVLGKEIATHYQRYVDGERDVPVPASTFGHYVAQERRWLASTEGAACEAYWREALDGAPPTIDLPLDRPREASPDFTADHVVRTLTEEETAAVGELARTVRATPFMAVTAAFHTALTDLTGTDDIVVGIDSLNRSWPGSEDLIGTFVNQLPVRLHGWPPAPESIVPRGTDIPRRLGAAPDFRARLELVRARCLDAYRHDRLPFHKIVAAVNPPRRAGRFPLFQVKLTQQGGWRQPVALPDIEVVPSDIAEPVTDLDLMLDVSGEATRLRLELVYRPEVLDQATAERWLDAVVAALRAGAAEQETVVATRSAR